MGDSFTVALIGADGSGKTTVARAVAATAPVPVKYLYMGMNPRANAFALPTSRLAYMVKRRAYRKGRPGAADEPAPDLGHIPQERGRLLATARLVNRLAEEWLRQLIAWYHHLRGYVVVCDRHFVVDFSARGGAGREGDRLTDRIHRWVLAHLYPHPDLVIFLDAPPEVLFERKGDAPLSYLRKRQQDFARAASLWPDFRRVDASQPTDLVVAEVSRHILEYRSDSPAGTGGR